MLEEDDELEITGVVPPLDPPPPHAVKTAPQKNQQKVSVILQMILLQQNQYYFSFQSLPRCPARHRFCENKLLDFFYPF